MKVIKLSKYWKPKHRRHRRQWEIMMSLFFPQDTWNAFYLIFIFIMARNQTAANFSPRQVLSHHRMLRISPPPIGKKRKIGKICVATWNIRNLLEVGKLHNVVLVNEMKHLRIDVLGVSECGWPHSDKIDYMEMRIYYSGSGNDADHRSKNGVAVIVSKDNKNTVQNVNSSFWLSSANTAQNLIQVYTPTVDKSEEKIEEFYNLIQEKFQNLSKNRISTSWRIFLSLNLDQSLNFFSISLFIPNLWSQKSSFTFSIPPRLNECQS